MCPNQLILLINVSSESDYFHCIFLQQNMYQPQVSMKRSALTDSKTGLPVYQPAYHQISHPQYANLQAVHQATALNTGFPNQNAPFAMQYAPYPFPIHCELLDGFLS
jgi:hypothetical protein